MVIKVKRAYDEPEGEDGVRILVDRLWPRGLAKEKAKVDLWLKDIAPSNKLRKWFSHEPERWIGFRDRYFKELDENDESVVQLMHKAKKGTITLLYGAKESRYNNAVALKEYIIAETSTKAA